MSTTYGATGLGQTAASTQRVSSFFKRYWVAFQERRKRQRLPPTTDICALSEHFRFVPTGDITLISRAATLVTFGRPPALSGS